MTNSQMPKKILIVGGGTAGWMAANLLAKRWQNQGVSIELLESPEIGIIGVGEGSTPQLKLFFDTIGVDESEWMPACNATFKNGIRFVDWSVRPGFEQYFHPFPAQSDVFTTASFFKHCHLRRQGMDVDAHPDQFFLASQLAVQGLGPKAVESFPLEVAYGYHFDSGLLGKFLAAKAGAAGVVHHSAKMVDIRRNEQGDITALILESGDQIAADFFIDCTGFASLLLQKKLGVPFVSFANNLFNDRAVVAPTPITPDIPPETCATALSSGWAWKIPLTNRYGNGYVYSSAFCSADQAEHELRSHLGLLDADVPVRHLNMKVGRVERHWHRNCLAVGLAQGFIEPLEATALHLVQETITGFIQAYERGGFGSQYRDEFNEKINRRFEGVRDYIVCHYRVSSRRDSEYWQANGANSNLSESLAAILNCWLAGGDVVAEVERQGIARYYQPESWACLLAGYGVFPEGLVQDTKTVGAQAERHKVREFIRRCALNFAPHGNCLSQ